MCVNEDLVSIKKYLSHSLIADLSCRDGENWSEARSGVFAKILLYHSKHHVTVGKTAAFRDKAKKFLAFF